MNKVMKETTTIEKPHLVENYVQSLMADHAESDDTITFPKVDITSLPKSLPNFY